MNIRQAHAVLRDSGLLPGTIARASEPFAHFVAPDFIRPDVAMAVLADFEKSPKWTYRGEPGFYDVYDLGTLDLASLPTGRAFASELVRDSLRLVMEHVFDTRLKSTVNVFAQKMVPGFCNKIHTDFGPRGQTHRLILQINRGWQPSQGGILMLFDGDPPTASASNQYVIPVSGTAIGFEISRKSFHAVSEVKSGTRYTVVFSFYAAT